MIGNVIYPLNAILLAQVSMGFFCKRAPLSDSILSGVSCCHETCFSRPRIVVGGTVYFSSYPVTAFTIVST